MKHHLTFELERPARKQGGDRYKCTEPAFDNFTIYIPQTISRFGGNPSQSLVVTFETEKNAS